MDPIFNWCALGEPKDLLWLCKPSLFLYHKLLKWPNLWQILHWCLLAGHLNPSLCWESPHFGHLSFLVCSKSNLLFSCGILGLSSSNLLASCLNLKVLFFLLNLQGGISVHWCHKRLTCITCGSLATCFICFAVALELSIFLASWHISLARNMLESILLSLIVLETNSSSFRKNNKIYRCEESWQFLDGTWLMQSVFVQHCTTHQHFYCPAWNLLTSQTLPWLH